MRRGGRSSGLNVLTAFAIWRVGLAAGKRKGERGEELRVKETLLSMWSKGNGVPTGAVGDTCCTCGCVVCWPLSILRTLGG